MISNLIHWLARRARTALNDAAPRAGNHGLDALRLEDRVLYSVTPLPDAGMDAQAAAGLDAALTLVLDEGLCTGLVLPTPDLGTNAVPGGSDDEFFLEGEFDGSNLAVCELPFGEITVSSETINDPDNPPPNEPRHELILVDQSIHNVEQLVQSLLAEAGPGEIDVVYLDSTRDGFAQVDQALSGDTRYDAVHFVTHGDAGLIRLGGSWLDATTIEQRIEQIQAWSDSLSEDADLLFYGCETAVSPEGVEWLGRLSELTGADVAASDDNTGNASRGGDWILEYHTGTLETVSLFSAEGQAAWDGLLATYVVTNTNDSGAGSLRQAIIDANTNVGADTISFNIDTSDPNYNALLGVWRIQPLTDLGEINDTVMLDAWTQPGFAGNPVIELDGSLAAGSTAGILLHASDSLLRGFIVHSFLDDGIEIGGDLGTGDNNIIQGNWVGINASGVAAPNGDHGILVTTGAANNLIGGTGANERNIISGNTHTGIVIRNANTFGNVVIGNYIGVGTDGVTAVGNGDHGIDLLDTTYNNRIGGVNAGEGNIIANSGLHGINVEATAGIGNAFLGNSIYSNGSLGIDLHNDGVTANDADDIDTGANDVQNYPGLTSVISGGGETQLSGSVDSAASTTYRIEFFSSPTGDASGQGEAAVYLGATTVTTDGSGDATFNVTLAGVSVTAGYAVTATATVDLGGGNFGSTSEFALNAATVLGNSSPTLDSGRSPALNSVLEDAGAPSGAVGTLISDLVDFAAPAGQVDNVTDPDGAAQLGIAITGADANGTWYYSTDNGSNWNLLGAVSGASARLLAADATTRIYFQPNANFNGSIASALTIRAWDQTAGSNGATADTTTNGGMTAFSSATDAVSLSVVAVNDAPVLITGSGTYVYPEGVGAVVLDPSATVTDIDSPDFSGGELRVEFTANGQAEDVFAIRNQGTGAGQIGTAGTNVTYGGVVIGTYTGGGNGTDPLIVTFNGNATVAAVQALTRNITYENTSDNPSVLVRTLQATVSDGDGGTSTAVTGNLSIAGVNDAPVNGVPAAQSMNEDATLVFNAGNGNLISLSDLDANAGNFTVTLTGTNGVITLGSTVGLAFVTGDGTADASLQFTGTLANVNAALNGLSFTSTANFNGSASIAITTSDNGNTGSGGTLTDNDTIAITVNPVNDAPQAADERLGISLDGTDDFVNAGSAASLEMTNTMTMEAWVNPDVSANVNQMIINKEGEYEVAIFANGHVQWAFANTSPGWGWHDTGYVVSPGEWTHIAVTYDNGVVTTYANGVAVDVFNGTGSIGDAHAALDDLRIGGRSNAPAGQYFDGRIDDVRIWNVARTGGEIAAAMNTELTGAEAGLAGYWNFNENSGTTANDLTANNNDGTLTNGADWYGYRITEDATLNSPAPGVLANDFDLEGDSLTAVLFSGPANGSLTLNPDGSFSYTPNLNFTGTDSFAYRAFDGTSFSNVATVTIVVDPVNDAPTITSNGGGATAAFSIAENISAVTTVISSDPDGGAPLYTISGGSDAGLFTIDGATGALSFLSAPDREALGDSDLDGVYEVTVQAADGLGGFDTQALSVTIGDADEFNTSPVTDVDGAANAINENAANGSLVGITALASDADATTNGITYSLDDSAGGRFAIDATNGIVTVANGTLLDYESAVNHSITVRATSADGSFSTQLFAISLLNQLNENDPVITSDGGGAAAAISLAENSVAVTTIIVVDADLPAQTLTFSIAGGVDAARFTVDANSGALTFLAAPNFEAPADGGADNVYNVTIQVSDGAGGTDSQALTVTVTGVNETPVAQSENFTVGNTETLTTNGPGVLANDSDPDGDVLSAILVTGPQHGMLTLNPDGSFTYTPNANFAGTDSFTYQSTDGTLASAPIVVQMTITQTGGPLPPDDTNDDSDEDSDSGGDDSPENDPDGDNNVLDDFGTDPGVQDNPFRPTSSSGPRDRRSDDSTSDVVIQAELPQRTAPADSSQAEEAPNTLSSALKGARRVATAAERVTTQALAEFIDADQLQLNLALVNLRNEVQSAAQLGTYIAGSVAIASAATSAGYALWALRSAHFVTTFLATIPAWRRFDPLPLINSPIAKRRDEGESLSEIALGNVPASTPASSTAPAEGSS